MNFFPKASLKILTIKGPKENEVSFCQTRGGIITSLKLRGQEILYLDHDTFQDTSKNVRGGIPILFPNAGLLENTLYPLRQHGLARTSEKWRVESKSATGLIETLTADEETKKIFPFDFQLKLECHLEQDGSVSLLQEVINKGIIDMPLALGLHPYFKVPKDSKKDIRFDFPGGEIIEKDFAKWSYGGTTVIDNPKLQDPTAILRVMIPEIGAVIMDISPEYRKIWVWSLPGRDFICFEPNMRGVNGLVDDPEIVAPQRSFLAKINYRLE